jgi:hypothetical protein
LVRLPPLFAPQAEEIQVSYLRPGARDDQYEISDELATALQHHAPGVFLLEVPYPHRGYRYALSWPLTEGPQPSEAAQQFRKFAQDKNKAGQCLQGFASVLNRSPVTTSVSLGLYVPNGQAALVRSSELFIGTTSRASEVPPSLSLRNDNTLYRNAWWGQIQRAVDYRGDTLGERAVAVVPIRQFGREDDVTWGLIRVGICADSKLSNDALAKMLAEHQMTEMFADGVLMVLQAAAQTG